MIHLLLRVAVLKRKSGGWALFRSNISVCGEQ